jgi:hypothetical protein
VADTQQVANRPTGLDAGKPRETQNASLFRVVARHGVTGEAMGPLKYAQTALLNFRGMSVPHVTVGTLTKAV